MMNPFYSVDRREASPFCFVLYQRTDLQKECIDFLLDILGYHSFTHLNKR